MDSGDCQYWHMWPPSVCDSPDDQCPLPGPLGMNTTDTTDTRHIDMVSVSPLGADLFHFIVITMMTNTVLISQTQSPLEQIYFTSKLLAWWHCVSGFPRQLGFKCTRSGDFGPSDFLTDVTGDMINVWNSCFTATSWVLLLIAVIMKI